MAQPPPKPPKSSAEGPHDSPKAHHSEPAPKKPHEQEVSRRPHSHDGDHTTKKTQDATRAHAASHPDSSPSHPHDHTTEKSSHTAHRHHRSHSPKKMWRLINRTILMRVAGICIAGVVGIGGGLTLKSYLAETEEGDVYGLEGKMQKLCKTKIDDLDCECLWENAGDAFTFENTSDILDILADRRRWTGQITRARIKKIADEKAAGLVSRSLYRCTLLF